MDARRAEELFPTLLPIAREYQAAIRSFPGHVTRFLRRRWKLLLALVLTPPLLHSLATVTTGRTVNSELARIRALGYPTSWDELLPRTPSARARARQEFLASRPLLRGLRRTGCEWPPMGGYEQPWSRSQWDTANQIATRVEPLADRSARINWAQAMSGAENEQEADELRLQTDTLVKGLLVSAIVETRNGHPERTASLLRLARRISNHKTEAHRDCWWSEMVDCHRTADLLLRIAATGPTSESACQQLYDAIPPLDAARLSRRIAERDLLNLIDFYGEVRRHGFGAMYCLSSGPPPSELEMRICGYFEAPWTNANEIVALRGFRRHRRDIRKSFLQLTQATKGRNPDRDPSWAPRWAWIVPMGGYVSPDRIARERDQAIATDRGNRLFLAVLAYEAKHGHYPARLGDVKQLGWTSLEPDPFTDRQFGYRLRADGFVLYSVGLDLQDNSGRHVSPTGLSDGSDIVWLNPAAIRQVQLDRKG